MKKKIVLKVQQCHRKCWSKDLGILDAADGVISSIAWKGEDKIVVVGDNVNPAKLNAILEKKFESANIEDVKVIKEEKKETKTKKIVFKVQSTDKKCWSKALGKLADADGVISSIAWEGEDKIVVVGDEVDPAKLNAILKKKFGSAKIEEVIKEDTENWRKKYQEQKKETEDMKKKYEEKKKETENLKKKYEDKKKETENLEKKYEDKKKENEKLRKRCEEVNKKVKK